MQVHRGRSRAIRFYNGGNGPPDGFSRLQSLVKHFFTPRDALRNWILDQNNQILSVLSTKQARKNLASGLEALWDMVGRSLGVLEGLPTLNKNETCCFLGVKCFWSSFWPSKRQEKRSFGWVASWKRSFDEVQRPFFEAIVLCFVPNNNCSFFSKGTRKNPYSKKEGKKTWMDASRHTKKILTSKVTKSLTLKEGKKIHGWMHRDIRKNPYFRVTKRWKKPYFRRTKKRMDRYMDNLIRKISKSDISNRKKKSISKKKVFSIFQCFRKN